MYYNNTGGYILSVIISALTIYLYLDLKKYRKIKGGDCSIINKYLNDSVLNKSWCNLEKKDTDKTHLTKDANKLLHSNISTNIKCKNEADIVYKDVENKCKNYYNEKKQEQLNTQQINSFGKFYYPTSFKDMSDYDLKKYVNVGDKNAIQEMANRNFSKNSEYYSVKSNKKSDDFCNIM